MGLDKGVPDIHTENVLLSDYRFVDINKGCNIDGYMTDAQRAVLEQIKFPPGYYVTWNSQFEYMEHAKTKLTFAVPMTLFFIIVLLYLNYRNPHHHAVLAIFLGRWQFQVAADWKNSRKLAVRHRHLAQTRRTIGTALAAPGE